MAALLGATDVVIVWQVDEGRERWRDFPKHLSDATEDQYNNRPTELLAYRWPTSGGRHIDYVIDVANMRQFRMDGDEVVSSRAIRRVLTQR